MSADDLVQVSLTLEGRTQPVVGAVRLECSEQRFSGWIELFSILHTLVSAVDAGSAPQFEEGET